MRITSLFKQFKYSTSLQMVFSIISLLHTLSVTEHSLVGLHVIEDELPLFAILLRLHPTWLCPLLLFLRLTSLLNYSTTTCLLRYPPSLDQWRCPKTCLNFHRMILSIRVARLLWCLSMLRWVKLLILLVELVHNEYLKAFQFLHEKPVLLLIFTVEGLF